VEILKKLAPEPTFAIDEIAQRFGHEAIRTPPYHPELQPIETCWGVVKNHVARTCDFTMSNLIEELDRGFNKVTAHTCFSLLITLKLKIIFSLFPYF
jgi:transposase